MNITTQLIILVILVAILFYAISEGTIELAEHFGLIADVEDFCAGPHCTHRHNHGRRYYNYYNNYYNTYDPYYGSYYGYWNNLWGYLPCVNNPFGSTYCW